MAVWTVTITGKNIRKASIEKLAKVMHDQFEGASICVTDASPPESRSDRFSDAISLIEDARSNAEGLREEMEEWLNGMPENLQQGSKAEEVQSAIDELENFISACEEAEGISVDFPGMY